MNWLLITWVIKLLDGWIDWFKKEVGMAREVGMSTCATLTCESVFIVFSLLVLFCII
jgi:hypothetical protein